MSPKGRRSRVSFPHIRDYENAKEQVLVDCRRVNIIDVAHI